MRGQTLANKKDGAPYTCLDAKIESLWNLGCSQAGPDKLFPWRHSAVCRRRRLDPFQSLGSQGASGLTGKRLDRSGKDVQNYWQLIEAVLS